MTISNNRSAFVHTAVAGGVAAVCLAFGFIQPTRAQDGEPTKIIRATTDAATQVLQRKDIDANEKRIQIEEIIKQYFDFQTLAKLTLARHWKELSAEQQVEFTREFEKHLSITYGKNVESYNDEKVVITGERADSGGDSTVKTKIARKDGPDILVDYRLRKGVERWQVIDVIIEGVSLVSNFRAQFQSIIARDGATRLIEILRDKNAKGESLKS